MSYSWVQVSLVVVHVLLFAVSLLGVDIFLWHRRLKHKQRLTRSRKKNPQDELDSSNFSAGWDGPSSLFSREKLGSFVFAVSCMASFGFVGIICTRVYLTDKADVRFFDDVLFADDLTCRVLIFLVTPVWLTYKLMDSEKQGYWMSFVLRAMFITAFWNSLASLCNGIVLGEMKFQMQRTTPVSSNPLAYWICGSFGTEITGLGISAFGLTFISVITGFTSIYVPYRVYVTRKEALTVTQVEHRIADANLVIHYLKKDIAKRSAEEEVEALSSDDEDELDEELVTSSRGFFRTSHFMEDMLSVNEHVFTAAPKPSQADGDLGSATSYVAAARKFFKSLASRFCSRAMERARSVLSSVSHFTARPALHQLTSVNFSTEGHTARSLKNLVKHIRQEREYLQDIKRHRELMKTRTGRLHMLLCYCEVLWAVRTIVVVLYRIIEVSSVSYGERCTASGNRKALAAGYHLFIHDNVVRRFVSDVLMGRDPPSYLDLTLSRISVLFLIIITAANMDHFLDFCRILFHVQRSKKKRRFTDNSIGMSFSAFLVLSVPSQFCLTVPFLQERQRTSALEMLFDKDIFVWMGLQHRFDTMVLIAMVFTVAGVAVLYVRRAKYYKLHKQIVCNV